MNKALNFTSLSASLTPKERAKLVIELTKKGMEDIYPDLDKPLTTEADIQQVIAGCPSNQAKDYNFLISLKNQVWERLFPLLEITILNLEVLVSRFHLYLLVCLRDEPGEVVSAEYEEVATAFSKAMTSRLSDVANYQEVIKKIQDNYFDGLSLDDKFQVTGKVDELVEEYSLVAQLYSSLSKMRQLHLKPIPVLNNPLTSFIDADIVKEKLQRFTQIAQTRR